ncbi:MAG: SDR family NAD(P)-dependent oxidoreductase [Alphaproteobacteria bacterium]|nr:SDR family NAD(P)-dependent oxidoreductase [Alphaproteobacteria bacterium]
MTKTEAKAYVVTGPTSGIGRVTALELAKHGTVVLVGRDPKKLDELKKVIEKNGRSALAIQCDLQEIASVRKAAKEITALNLPIAGLLNNAGVLQPKPTKNSLGWDTTFTTNHLGAFALTEELASHLPDGASVVFIASALEDPERKPAKVMGMRGGRFLSIEASARGEWRPGGCKIPGIDAYATSKQCSLASVFALARENSRLRFNAVEPGINPSTGLGGANAFMRFVFGQIITRLPPFSQYRSTPERAAQVITRVLTDPSTATGIYFDEKGQPMSPSQLVQDTKFQDRVVVNTRAFLSPILGIS